MTEIDYSELFIQCCMNGHLAPAIFALEKTNSQLLINKGIDWGQRIGNANIIGWLVSHPKFDIDLFCGDYVDTLYTHQTINYVVECFNKKQFLEIAYYKLISIPMLCITPIHAALGHFYKPGKYKNIVDHVYHLAIHDDNINAMKFLYHYGRKYIRNLTKRLICETLDLGNTVFVRWYFSNLIVSEDLFTYGIKYKKDKYCLYKRVILYINCFNDRQTSRYRYHPVISDAILNRYTPVIFNENYPKWFKNHNDYNVAMLSMKNGLKIEISMYLNITADIIGLILDYVFGIYRNLKI